jgi:very-short-patch-repair endonuclease
MAADTWQACATSSSTGLRVVRYDNVQVPTEIEAVLQHLLTAVDEQVVNSLRSHPPYPPF